jgi:predicted restriction endonuclease
LQETVSLSEDEKNEYAIQNRRREIEARQKQSVFRRKVLANFEHKCCLTGITETQLLIASHIVPWSTRIDSRLDPSNGLCLSVLYDKLFDKGFITFEDDLQVRITSNKNILSTALQSILLSLQDSSAKAKKPVNYPINTEYLEYHRDVVFLK